MANILVIDDEEQVRSLLRHTLEDAGHVVVESTDGEEGIARYREAPMDLVVTDIVMPDKEGIETIMEFRKLDAEIRILAISGGGRLGNLLYLNCVLNMAQLLGATRVLAKPFGGAEFLRAVDECLGKSDSVRQEAS
jgi:CheY-like chemotaxis protein